MGYPRRQTSPCPVDGCLTRIRSKVDGVRHAREQHPEIELSDPHPIRFYRATGDYGFLSNLWPVPVQIPPYTFRSAEHAYQYGKPKEEEVRRWIGSAPAPRFAAIAGHGLFPYDVAPEWETTKVGWMKTVPHAPVGWEHPEDVLRTFGQDLERVA